MAPSSQGTDAGARLRQLVTVRQFVELFPAFSTGSIRWLLFRRRANGLDHAVIQLGRRVLIDVEAFSGWLADMQAPNSDARGQREGRSSAVERRR